MPEPTEPIHEFPADLAARLAELDAARSCLLAEVEGARREMSAAEVAGSDVRWSLAQLVYHLHLAETLTTRGFQKKLAAADRAEPPAVEQLRDEWERVRKIAGTRNAKMAAPARVVPDGAPDLDQALTLLAESRRAFRQVIENTPEKDLLSIVLPHPFPAIGNLAGVSWISVTAFHELRHCEQIREMAAGAATLHITT